MLSMSTYHHGDLPAALLRAAGKTLERRGIAALSLREAARRAGVSHNAPYRHFPDREGLLAAVAAQGFRELTQAMLDAAKQESNAITQLKCAGLTYVDFALRRPEHFMVMFDSPIARRKTPDSAEAAEQAFATLVGLVKKCQDEDLLPAGDLRQFTLLAWSMVHGIAKLATAKRLPYKSKADVLKFAKFVINQSLPVRDQKS